MTKYQGLLEVRGFDLKVNLGWRDKEMAVPQAVMLDLDIFYTDAPNACTSDALADTICYATMLDKVCAHVGNKKFRLIEHLAHEIYQVIEPDVPQGASLAVKITKKPKIKGLTGGVSYRCTQKKEDR